jgi:hypothetical protein
MDADSYRAKAAEMRRLAAEQTSPAVKAEYEQMARGWEAMARRRDAQDGSVPKSWS